MAQIFVNDARTTLSASIAPGSLSLPVVDTSTFPMLTGSDYMIVTLEQSGQIEIVKLIAPGKSAGLLIVDPSGRGWEGTTALSFPLGARVEGRITAGSIETIVSGSNAAVGAETSRAMAAEAAEASTRASADTNEAVTRAAVDATKSPLNSPGFTGIPTAPTAAPGTSTLQLATCAFVANAASTLNTAINAETSRAMVAEAALSAEIASTGGIGSISYFPVLVPPAGYLECQGGSYSPSGIYANLFAIIGYNIGNVGGNFVIPDLRGEFIRGWDDGRGIDSGRVMGSWQADSFASHTHPYQEMYTYAANTYVGYSTDPTYANQAATTGATGGTETRPRNVALMACIKYQ